MNTFMLSEKDMDNLLSAYDKLHNAGVLSETEASFAAACSWLRAPENYATWSGWLNPLPSCEYDVHYSYTIEGCDSTSNGTDTFPRRMKFYWRSPRPENASLPYNCDPFHLPNSRLPSTLSTSRSCSWLSQNSNTWLVWATLGTQPTCDTSFYTYDVSGVHQLGSARGDVPLVSSQHHECVVLERV